MLPFHRFYGRFLLLGFFLCDNPIFLLNLVLFKKIMSKKEDIQHDCEHCHSRYKSIFCQIAPDEVKIINENKINLKLAFKLNRSSKNPIIKINVKKIKNIKKS